MPQENPRFLKLRALTTVAVIAFGLLAGCAPSTESATEAVEPRVTVTIQAEPTAISTPAIPEEPPDYCQPPTKGRNQCNTIYSGDLVAIQSLEFEAQDLFFLPGADQSKPPIIFVPVGYNDDEYRQARMAQFLAEQAELFEEVGTSFAALKQSVPLTIQACGAKRINFC